MKHSINSRKEMMMDELKDAIEELDIKRDDLYYMMIKTTEYGRSPLISELLELAKPIEEIGKVMYAAKVLNDLREAIEFNAKHRGDEE